MRGSALTDTRESTTSQLVVANRYIAVPPRNSAIEPSNRHMKRVRGRAPALQHNIDATAMTQAGVGASYIQSIVDRRTELSEGARDQVTAAHRRRHSRLLQPQSRGHPLPRRDARRLARCPSCWSAPPYPRARTRSAYARRMTVLFRQHARCACRLRRSLRISLSTSSCRRATTQATSYPGWASGRSAMCSFLLSLTGFTP